MHATTKPLKPVAWHSTGLVRISIVLHLVAVLALIFWPQGWLTILVVIALNHLVITVTGLLPRSDWLGSNWTYLPPAAAARNEVALTIDDGPDPDVTPQVLMLLDHYGVRATFFCIGDQALRYPELCREIVQRGHAVENHSQSHRHYFSLQGTQGLQAEILKAQQTITQVTGRTPQFFRAPAGLRNMFLAPVLSRMGLQLASWSVRAYDTQQRDVNKVRTKLLNGLNAGAIILLHDGHAARTEAGIPMIIAVLPALLETARAKQLRFVTLAQATVGDTHANAAILEPSKNES